MSRARKNTMTAKMFCNNIIDAKLVLEKDVKSVLDSMRMLEEPGSKSLAQIDLIISQARRIGADHIDYIGDVGDQLMEKIINLFKYNDDEKFEIYCKDDKKFKPGDPKKYVDPAKFHSFVSNENNVCEMLMDVITYNINKYGDKIKDFDFSNRIDNIAKFHSQIALRKMQTDGNKYPSKANLEPDRTPKRNQNFSTSESKKVRKDIPGGLPDLNF